MRNGNGAVRVAAGVVGAVLACTALAGCGSDSGGGGDAGSSPGTGTSKPDSGGGGKTDVSAVQSAYRKTAGAETAAMGMVVEVRGGDKTAKVAGKGVIDLKGGESDMTLLSEGQKIRQRTVGQIIYQQPPAQARKQLPQGKTWIKIDPGKLKEQQEGSSDGGQLNDPAQSFGYLKGVSDKDVRKLGTESVGGTKTTHYRVNLDVDKLAEDAGGAQGKQLKQQLGADVPLDVWLDGDGRMRQQKMKLTMKQSGSQSGAPQKASVTTTLTFDDFGTDVNVEAPPAKDTVDMTDKLAQQGEQTA